MNRFSINEQIRTVRNSFEAHRPRTSGGRIIEGKDALAIAVIGLAFLGEQFQMAKITANGGGRREPIADIGLAFGAYTAIKYVIELGVVDAALNAVRAPRE